MSPKNFTAKQQTYWNDSLQRERRDPRNPIIAAYTQPKIRYVLQHIHLTPRATILDVGAGNGYFSYEWNRHAPTTAIDYSPVILEKNPVERKFVMDARSLAFPDATFECVFCHALLHHVEKDDRLQVLREMARVTKRYVVYIEPNIWNPIIAGFSTVKREEHGALCFTPQYVRSLAKAANLHIITSCSWGLLTPNRMPFATLLSSFFRLFERPFPLGVTTIVVAEVMSPWPHTPAPPEVLLAHGAQNIPGT